MASLNLTRDVSPETYLAAQLDGAFEPLRILGDNKLELARVNNARANQARLLEDARAYNKSVVDESRTYAERENEKQRQRRKDDTAEDRLRAMRVQAAGLGISTVGKDEEALAAEISRASHERDMTRAAEKFTAEKKLRGDDVRQGLGLPSTATDQEVDIARARATGISTAAAQAARIEEEGKAADAWLSRPESKPVIDRWIKLNREQDRLLAHNVNDLFQMPAIDKARVGAAVAANPDIALKLTPAQLQIVRSGNWEMLSTNPQARLKPDLARTLLEIAAEETARQEQQGLLMSKINQSAEARAAGPKLESIRRQLQAMQQSNPYLMRVVEPMEELDAGGTDPGDPDPSAPPLPSENPLLIPSASVPAPALTPAPVARRVAAQQPDPFAEAWPVDPRAALAELSRRRASDPRVSVSEAGQIRNMLLDRQASLLGVQPESIGSSSLGLTPAEVMQRDGAAYDRQFEALPARIRNPLYIDILREAALNPVGGE